MKFKLLLISMLILLLTGCSTRLPKEFSHRTDVSAEAKRFYAELDRHLKNDKIASALGNKIDGFPYLRTNRFFTELKGRLLSDSQKKEWVEHLFIYDLKARSSDIKALSPKAFGQLKKKLTLPENDSRDNVIDLLEHYARQLFAHDQSQVFFYETIINNTNSPDAYSTSLRILGLYPLAYYPVVYFTKKSYEQMNRRFQTPKNQLPIMGKLTSYLPEPVTDVKLTGINRLFDRVPKDSIGIRKFGLDHLQTLVQFYAPGFLIDVADKNDLPGKLLLKNHGVEVDTIHPAVYYYFSHALVKNIPVFQINYVIWFPARKGLTVPWYEQGKIDGFTYRVTLNDNGIPLLIDNIHNCGCYHFLAPDKSQLAKLKSMATEFGNQVPAWMPEDYPKQKILLNISSGWHQVSHLGTYTSINAPRTYELLPYSDIESLNIFNKQGVIRGTSRKEPMFLFPMGIPDIGAMRQRTHQPTRLLGKEHFDNPLLLENYFEFK